MDISIYPQGNVQVVHLTGDLKIGDAVDALRAALDNLIGSGNCRIVVDLARLRMMDSSGIGAVVRALASAKQRGGSLKLVNPNKMVLQTLKIVGLLNLFEVYDDEAQAVGSYA